MKYIVNIFLLLAGILVGYLFNAMLTTSPEKSWERVVQFKALANLVAHEKLTKTRLIFTDIPRSRDNLIWIMTNLNHDEVVEAGSPEQDYPFIVNVFHTPKYEPTLNTLIEDFKVYSKSNEAIQQENKKK